MPRPTKIEEVDKKLRKELIKDLYWTGNVEMVRIARIFKMSIQNVWGVINDEKNDKV
jgi:hypothetical protein